MKIAYITIEENARNIDFSVLHTIHSLST